MRRCCMLLGAVALVLWFGESATVKAQDYRDDRVYARDLHREIERAFSLPGAWRYEPIEGEWEYDYPRGEIEYEPENGLRPPTRAERLERAVQRELSGPGSWEYEPFKAEWEYEGNGEIDLEPAYGYYRDGYADDDWFYDWYDYGWR